MAFQLPFLYWVGAPPSRPWSLVKSNQPISWFSSAEPSSRSVPVCSPPTQLSVHSTDTANSRASTLIELFRELKRCEGVRSSALLLSSVSEGWDGGVQLCMCGSWKISCTVSKLVESQRYVTSELIECGLVQTAEEEMKTTSDEVKRTSNKHSSSFTFIFISKGPPPFSVAYSYSVHPSAPSLCD